MQRTLSKALYSSLTDGDASRLAWGVQWDLRGAPMHRSTMHGSTMHGRTSVAGEEARVSSAQMTGSWSFAARERVYSRGRDSIKNPGVDSSLISVNCPL